MDISRSLARSMSGASSRSSFAITPLGSIRKSRSESVSSKDISIYKGISERPMGWKPRRFTNPPNLISIAKEMNVRKWDGVARQSMDWDGLRRDRDLWDPTGNCLIHLYAQGQSKRGPAFRVPIAGLLTANCHPIFERFLVESSQESPISDQSSIDGYFDDSRQRLFELYIPAPSTVERGEAFLYHLATRNFFAWIFGKSLVGNHLGAALVALLNSMTEFRSAGEDNIQDIINYMNAEGYADMRNQPDHALAVLFFAEHFQFKNLYIDAFAQCTGMNEKIIASPGFEFMSRSSRALVTRSRFEMDMRLDRCGRMLGTFLADDLPEADIGFSVGARSHLDKFRSFLQSYYIAKLGYYPPTPVQPGTATFPKHIYRQMCGEFQKLYEYLADPTQHDEFPQVSQQRGVCVLQSIQAINRCQKFTPLKISFPLLPENEEKVVSRPSLGRRLSFIPKSGKMIPDPRLVTIDSLSKATNRQDASLLDCTLVRAYRGFEKESVLSSHKVDKSERLSHSDSRKVRWILIYSILQTLISATHVPEQVRDAQNVAYNLSVLTAGCPPWKDDQPFEALLRTQTDQTKEDFLASVKSKEEDIRFPGIKSDIDFLALTQKPQSQYSRDGSGSSLSSMASRKSSVRKALSTLGNMPELKHPRPQRASHHEILVHGYGNGTNIVKITAEPLVSEPFTIENDHNHSLRKMSSDSGSSSNDVSSRWSHTDAPSSSIG